ncbi:M4 family metallopeptidase [Pseudoalteromonas sp. DL2-H2.2]|uniref:M4 family metallopeptidase n=1 Tax=Pseudoalteromonas sp. DL2-H2.2 TaxID=2908889 RepID=UPI001F3F0D03|nr:M4 family metallopeptidase [Pseudoalteromonas sp. DL2-H2.2]MCF2910664.1 M4 family metallopeptidase [Pseudoalteromonas sp. DL2-H2.2]
MPIKKASLAAFLCGVSCLSNAATQWVDTHSLLNQQHLWHEVENQLKKQARAKAAEVSGALSDNGIRYQRVKTIGNTKRFEHHQVYYRGIPVIGGQFVLFRDSTGKVLQGLGATIRAQELPDATDGRYFSLPSADIEQRLAADLTSETKLQDLRRAYLTWQGRLMGVFQVTATSKEGIRTLTIDADTLNVLKSEQGIMHSPRAEQGAEQLSDGGQYVAAGGIGGNEKMGAICYSPQPSTMEACLRYQYDETTSPSTELLFNDVSDTARPLIFADFDGYPFVVRKEGGRCFLENPYVQTIDYYSHHTDPFMYGCDGYYEYFNGDDVGTDYYDYFSYGPLSDAHFYGGLTMQFFHKQLNELFPNQVSDCPIDGYCLQTLKQRVRNNTFGMNQAYWDGAYVNYGTGYYGVSHYSLTTSSIVAYEAAYAMTHWNSQLESWGEAGAFYQAFSDISSIAVLDYLQHSVSGSFSTSEPFLSQILDGTGRPQDDKKWWLGWDVRVQDVGERYFSLPSLDGSSIDHLSAYSANMSRYEVGGLFRKAFYELVKTYGWTIEEAFKLFLNANISCLPANASLDDAATCLMLVADSSNVGMLVEEARKDVDGALHLVGLVAQTSEISSLPVAAMPQYDEFMYLIETLPISEIERISVDWGNGVTEGWSRNSGSAIYPFLQREHGIEPDLLTRFKINVVKTDGEELLAYRDYYSRALGVACPPWFGEDNTGLMSQVLINGHNLQLLPQNYQEILDQPLNLYLKQRNTIELGAYSAGQEVTVLLDTNRNGAYEEQEVYLVEEITDTGLVSFSLPEGFLPGKIMMRVVVGSRYGFFFSCGEVDEGQVFDVKVDFSGAGEWLRSDFNFEIQSGNKVKFTNSFLPDSAQPSEKFEQPMNVNSSTYIPFSSAISYPMGFQTCLELVFEKNYQRNTYSELSNLFACQTKKDIPQIYSVLHPT